MTKLSLFFSLLILTQIISAAEYRPSDHDANNVKKKLYPRSKTVEITTSYGFILNQAFLNSQPTSYWHVHTFSTRIGAYN